MMQEIYETSCGSHIRGKALVQKVLLVGYFWPTLQRGAERLTSTYPNCQKHQHVI